MRQVFGDHVLRETG